MKVLFRVMVLAIFLPGCASVMEGGDQGININTTGCEESGLAICSVRNSEGASTITAPASVSVEKARGPLTVSCETRDKMATGSVVVESKYEAMNAGNILVGGIIGIGVDAATGAMWKYPTSIVVPMRCPDA